VPKVAYHEGSSRYKMTKHPIVLYKLKGTGKSV
jgi:hypothetical protein